MIPFGDAYACVTCDELFHVLYVFRMGKDRVGGLVMRVIGIGMVGRVVVVGRGGMVVGVTHALLLLLLRMLVHVDHLLHLFLLCLQVALLHRVITTSLHLHFLQQQEGIITRLEV